MFSLRVSACALRAAARAAASLRDIGALVPAAAEAPVPSPDVPLSEAYSSAIVSISQAADLKAS